MGWEYETLGDICTIEKGNIGINKAISGDYPLVVMGSERKSHNEYQFDEEAVIIPLVSSTGHGHRSMNRIHFQSGKFSIGSILCAVIPKDKTVLSAQYLYRYLDLYKEQELVGRMKGMANVSLSMKSIAEVEIPIPPIEIQQKIVSKFDDVEKSNENLSSEHTHQLDLLKKLRQQILQDAVQGKLVPQDPNDEPASKLLQRIKAEKEQLIKEKKIKKSKPLPEIKPEEIPFEIPDSWVWCRLGVIIYDTEGGKSPNCLNEPVNGSEWGVIKTTAVQEMLFIENENKVLPNGFIVNEHHKIIEGDVLITRAGPKNRVGVVCCVKNLTKNLILSDKTIRIKHSKHLINSEHLSSILNSHKIKSVIEDKMTGMADSQVNISQENMKGFPIPLPPINEQNRIVTKIEQLMSLCDDLEHSIQQNQKYTQELLQVALKEALEPK